MIEKQIKILIVDDNEESLDMLELFLYQDYEITTASNGLEGLEKALTIKPDIIISDVVMSGISGIQLFNKLRNNTETENIPVIVVTAFTKAHSIPSLINIGFNDVIVKPISRTDLMKSIKNIIEKSGGHHEK